MKPRAISLIVLALILGSVGTYIINHEGSIVTEPVRLGPLPPPLHITFTPEGPIITGQLSEGESSYPVTQDNDIPAGTIHFQKFPKGPRTNTLAWLETEWTKQLRRYNPYICSIETSTGATTASCTFDLRDERNNVSNLFFGSRKLEKNY
ncbi:MAG: hypothetical protein UY21_C0014G0013 [Microgenomates group bacterium GW2011_GWA1_48_10]|nr:MAG: hypothetical protein UY21_C0014G0013 [Microgenomates group bacterium GW2011_GWA1_48_10]